MSVLTALVSDQGGNLTTEAVDLTVLGGFSPPDIADHGFEDGTSGPFVTTGMQPIIPNSPWDLDTGTAARGANSIKWSIGGGANNAGNACNHVQPGNETLRKAVYVRWAMKFSDPFNDGFNGVFKVYRNRSGGFGSGVGTLVVQNSNGFTWGWDSTNPASGIGANTNLPAPDGFDFIGEWHWVEIWTDISIDGFLRLKIWIDDVLYWDHVTVGSNRGRNLRVQQLALLANSTTGPGTVWLDQIALSTQRIGVPA